MIAPWEDRFALVNVARFDPATLAIIAGVGVVAGLAGSGIAAAGQLQGGAQAQQAANYNAQVAENDATQAEDASAFEEEASRKRAARLMATQRALYGKSGVTMEGSPVAVLGDTAAQAELDALAIRYQGQVTASRARSQANLDRYEGDQAVTGSRYAATGTLLTGVGNAFGSAGRSLKL